MLDLFAVLVLNRTRLKKNIRYARESFENLLRVLEAERPKKKKKKNAVDPPSLRSKPLVDALKSLSFSHDKAGDSIVVTGLYRYIRQELENYTYVRDWDNGTHLEYSDAALPEQINSWGAEFRASPVAKIDLVAQFVRGKTVDFGTAPDGAGRRHHQHP
jgi:hypothetical protein